MLDRKNVAFAIVAVGILSISCMEAELHIIHLKLTARHLGNTNFRRKRKYSRNR